MAWVCTQHSGKFLKNHLYLGKHWTNVLFHRWLSKNVADYVFPIDLAKIIEKYYKDDIGYFPLLWYPAETLFVVTQEEQKKVLTIGADEEIITEEQQKLMVPPPQKTLHFNTCGKNNCKSACVVLGTVDDTSLKYRSWRLSISKNKCHFNSYYNFGCVSIPSAGNTVSEVVEVVKHVESKGYYHRDIFPNICKVLAKKDDCIGWWISTTMKGFSTYYNSINCEKDQGITDSFSLRIGALREIIEIYGKVDKNGSFIHRVAGLGDFSVKHDRLMQTHLTVMIITAPVCACPKAGAMANGVLVKGCKHHLSFLLTVGETTFDFEHPLK